MKIISWNVNGLRAVYKKNQFLPLFQFNPDIVCLQEIKAEEAQIPEEARLIPGYQSFFNSSKTKKGYSGVAIYTKIKPDKIEYGMGTTRFDDEGRMLSIYLDDYVIITVYFPNGGAGPERLQYKLDFYDGFLFFIEKLRKEGKKIIFCGDVNTAHQAIDLARPKENEKNTGFLPIERAWIDQVINHGYIDIFRQLNPEVVDAYTYWDRKTAARDRNVGWRIDYFFISPNLKDKIIETKILSDYEGSDHCPIILEIAI
ncbi:exodeoxyribonuclease III [Candidatus Azambacteria bacterium]|nr:exodeoxyribonuclease III [Candidatus Azambacteria bacterium]